MGIMFFKIKFLYAEHEVRMYSNHSLEDVLC